MAENVFEQLYRIDVKDKIEKKKRKSTYFLRFWY